MTLPDFSRRRRVLIVKPSSLGDIVHTLPAVRLLKKRWPEMEFTWLVNPEFASVLEGNPDLAGTLPFPRGNFRGVGGLLRFRRWLKDTLPQAGPWDVALDFQGLLRSGLIAKASGADARIGLSDSREGAWWFHTGVVPVEGGAHAVERYLAVPRELDAGGPVEFPLPEGSCPAALVEGNVPAGAVLLHPFSRGKGKSLTAAQTVRLCERLAPRPVLIVGRSDTPLSGTPENARNLLNATTLPELLWLIRRAACVISVDSGPMHMAAALTPRVLSLHTWSDPARVGPWRPDAFVWKAGGIFPAREVPAEIRARHTAIPDTALPEIADWARRFTD